MDRLWAPWRIDYILREKDDKCFLCERPKEKDDEKNLIVFRGKKCFVILNRYPYNSGHLMIAPYRHILNIEELEDEESEELFYILKKTIIALKEAFRPEGFNVGTNLGEAAGAGEEHLHFHVLPRWIGDTNFMPTLADVKVLPEHLKTTYEKLSKSFKG